MHREESNDFLLCCIIYFPSGFNLKVKSTRYYTHLGIYIAFDSLAMS